MTTQPLVTVQQLTDFLKNYPPNCEVCIDLTHICGTVDNLASSSDTPSPLAYPATIVLSLIDRKR